MRPDELWEGTSVKQRTIRNLMKPLGWLYALGWEAYLATYSLGFKRAAEPHYPVFCIGSLSVGGSGKSPLTMHIASVLKGLGKEVVIGCSGYGAPHSKDAELAPAGPLAAAEWGDEPAMFRWLLPEVPLVVGRNRVLAAQVVQDCHPEAVLLMDDGFQHLPLKKHVTLILDDPNVKNKSCLPAGPNREPTSSRKRADLIIPDDFQLVREQMKIVDHEGNSVVPKEYSILCALGQPEKFIRALAAQFPNGQLNPPKVLLPDHDPLTGDEILALLPVDLPIIVTAKDWVKLRVRQDLEGRKILVALQEVRLEPHEKFKTWVERRLNE